MSETEYKISYARIRAAESRIRASIITSNPFGRHLLEKKVYLLSEKLRIKLSERPCEPSSPYVFGGSSSQQDQAASLSSLTMS